MAVMMRERWTGERLDDLNDRVADGFRRIDERFREVSERFDRLEARFEDESRYTRTQFGRIDARLDSIQRAIIFSAITFSGSVIAGFVTLAATGG